MGIKRKKKKKFRKWQKNSGAIFEKRGVIMGWWDIVKNDFWFDLNGLRFASVDGVFTFYEEFNQTLQDAEALTMRLESDKLESGDMEYEIEERYMEENGSVKTNQEFAILTSLTMIKKLYDLKALKI